jgi:predicted RNA-binding Zn ribbon-like protein
MHWVEVDGVRLPKRIGGHVALDFCNTWAGWGEAPEPRSEWLPDYPRLVAWAGFAELLDPGTAERLRRAAQRRPAEAARVLTSTRTLRRNLYAAVLHPNDTPALGRVSSYLRDAGQRAVLRPGPGGPAHWDFQRGTGLATPLLAVARAAGELLTSPDVLRVKACPGENCGWLFIDRRGRRRWCSMSSCGNRAKVRAHADRNRT